MKLNFGKYKGMSLEAIANIDRNYLIWLKNKTDLTDKKYGEANKKRLEAINQVLGTNPVQKEFAKPVKKIVNDVLPLNTLEAKIDRLLKKVDDLIELIKGNPYISG